MRVISGKRKGHKLKSPKGLLTRPTEDRIKEALFNILGQISTNSKVLDLFSGSGSIAIEFLSRGAEIAYFVDNSKASIEIIRENLIHTKLIDKSVVIKQDSLKAIQYFMRKDLKFDYIYLDPPFSMHQLLLDTISSIGHNEILKEEGILIVEHDRDFIIENSISNLSQSDFRVFGSKAITFYEKISKEDQ